MVWEAERHGLFPAILPSGARLYEAFDIAAEWLGGLDALIHNAAIHGTACPNVELTDDELDRVIAVNSKGTGFNNQAAYPLLKERGGSIVNFFSSQGVNREAFGGAYSMTKAGVLGWSRSLAPEWGRDNIRVNTICPYIASPLVNEHASNTASWLKDMRSLAGIVYSPS